MSNQKRNRSVSQKRSGHAAKDHFGCSIVAISSDNNEIGIVAFRIRQDDLGNRLAMRLHPLDAHLGSVTN